MNSKALPPLSLLAKDGDVGSLMKEWLSGASNLKQIKGIIDDIETKIPYMLKNALEIDELLVLEEKAQEIGEHNTLNNTVELISLAKDMKAASYLQNS